MVAAENIQGFEVQLLKLVLLYQYRAFQSMARSDCYLNWLRRSSEGLASAGILRVPPQLEAAIQEYLALAAAVVVRYWSLGSGDAEELDRKDCSPTF